MGLFSSLKRKSSEPAARRQPPQDPAQVETLRTRARRRLIGAAVLVGAAVVGLPYVFDATPRPVQPTMQVRMPGEPEIVVGTTPPAASAVAGAASGHEASASTGSSAASSAATAAAGKGTAVAMAGGAVLGAVAAGAAVKAATHDDGIITESKESEAERLAREKAAQAARDKEKERQRLKAEKAEKERADRAERERADREKARKEKAAREAEAERERIRQDKERAERLDRIEKEKARKEKERREREKEKEKDREKDAKAAKDDRRYVVQVGSFSEARTVRETRQRVEDLGLKSFEQHVDTSSGRRTRVRLGPFATKEEAARAASKLKAAGVSAAVLPL